MYNFHTTSPYIVAITGGICSGKNTIAKEFYKLSNVKIIDSDIISKNIIYKNKSISSSIIQYFDSNIFYSYNTLNRTLLRKHIFSNLTDKKWLEKLLHPIIRKETQKKIFFLSQSNISGYIIWIVPLLIERNLLKYADRILVVDVPIDTQINRIFIRDGNNQKEAEKIILSQSTQQDRFYYAHDIIENKKDPSYNAENIRRLHEFYIKLSNIKRHTFYSKKAYVKT